MRKVLMSAIAVPLLCLNIAAHANVFTMASGLTSLETVIVGNSGNVGELSGGGAGGYGPNRICGAVNYAYQIGKFEVTAAQYTEFLNKVAKADTYDLYNRVMDRSSGYDGCNITRSGGWGNYTYSVSTEWANRPVNFVSFWDACRFVNWLNNGQPAGAEDSSTTEDGAYTLNGYNLYDGRNIQRNTGATWFIPNEDEWYKAAYNKGSGINAGYWDYPTQSDTPPSNDLLTPDPGHNANYSDNGSTIGEPYYRNEVGAFTNSTSAYGTYDQGGNVWEWNETVVSTHEDHALRSYRGGAFSYGASTLCASYRGYGGEGESNVIGFRVAGIVPEPSSILALVCGIGGLAWRKKNLA